MSRLPMRTEPKGLAGVPSRLRRSSSATLSSARGFMALRAHCSSTSSSSILSSTRNLTARTQSHIITVIIFDDFYYPDPKIGQGCNQPCIKTAEGRNLLEKALATFILKVLLYVI